MSAGEIGTCMRASVCVLELVGGSCVHLAWEDRCACVQCARVHLRRRTGVRQNLCVGETGVRMRVPYMCRRGRWTWVLVRVCTWVRV